MKPIEIVFKLFNVMFQAKKYLPEIKGLNSKGQVCSQIFS